MPGRNRHVEIRRVGDETTEQAFLAALGHKNIDPIKVGVCERWMRVPPERKAEDALKALANSGARVLKP